jgi:DNA repair protein RadC
MAKQGDLFTRGVAEVGAWPPGSAAEIDLWRSPACSVEGLAEADLLQQLLARFGSAEPRSAADALLARFGGIGRVLGAPLAELASVAGAEVAQDLCRLHALLMRALAYPLEQRTVLTSWEAVKTYLSAGLRARPREAFHVLFLDRKNQLIADERLTEGTVDHAPVYPREVVRRALELSASALVLAHNHPSGDPSPSQADIEITRQIVAAAKTLQIAVHDHLIIGANQVVSLRAQGLM